MTEIFQAAIAACDSRLERAGDWWLLTIDGVTYAWQP
jgi:hypothetical protein